MKIPDLDKMRASTNRRETGTFNWHYNKTLCLDQHRSLDDIPYGNDGVRVTQLWSQARDAMDLAKTNNRQTQKSVSFEIDL